MTSQPVASSVLAPLCPVCGGLMRLRTARRGEFAGRDFWGCVAFAVTNCPGKIDIGIGSRSGAPPVAGATPQAIFEARRDRERTRRRALLPAVVSLAVIAMVMEFLLFWSFSLILAIVVIGITGIAFVKVVTELPNDVISWERGAKGEQATASHLKALEPAGFLWFANRWAVGLRGDIDAIVVGPPGVYVVETKTTTSKVEVIRDGLYLGDYDKQDWLDQTTREALAVQIGLRDLLDPLHRSVVPVICVQGRGSGLGRTVMGVEVLSSAQLVATLSAAARVLSEADVQRIAEAVDQRFSRQRRG